MMKNKIILVSGLLMTSGSAIFAQDGSACPLSNNVSAFDIVLLALIVILGIIVFMKRGTKSVVESAAPASSAPAAVAAPVAVAETKDNEIMAAIAFALQLSKKESSKELHDVEYNVITMEKIERSYSPWSSKIHVMTKNPREN